MRMALDELASATSDTAVELPPIVSRKLYEVVAVVAMQFRGYIFKVNEPQVCTARINEYIKFIRCDGQRSISEVGAPSYLPGAHTPGAHTLNGIATPCVVPTAACLPANHTLEAWPAPQRACGQACRCCA